MADINFFLILHGPL